ncbi:hypothetical protein JFY74_04550 [Pectobacterium carotovorum]|uniref:ParB/Sulfiredoxin domain-containing protein n=1 Tax=Pectobacterium odoriferum TaxID=78398 RepID=A0ABR4VK00_9GAMM|nr:MULTISPECIES: hypothetical protein [Pectobacterium]AZK61364.1 hypothetical protein EIP93_03085 [Pectobacterium versatile]KGA39679.1 hypothetical protein KU75_21100 [Pectobacterium odoriferum]MCU1793479.1 hypothetical protein [Pectobacterium polaris]QQG29340.1 hypothetical protein JFY74_04550 [Pectobacterium carotovorum]
MYLDEPVSKWPPLRVTWSKDPDGRDWAFDGDPPEWAAPVGKLRLGSALTAEIHAHLIYARKIDCVEELREGAIDDKIEDVINHWKDGDALTPPVLRIVEINGVKKIDIADGNHRFNVAHLTGEIKITFLASPVDSASLEALIPSLVWKP